MTLKGCGFLCRKLCARMMGTRAEVGRLAGWVSEAALAAMRQSPHLSIQPVTQGNDLGREKREPLKNYCVTVSKLRESHIILFCFSYAYDSRYRWLREHFTE